MNTMGSSGNRSAQLAITLHHPGAVAIARQAVSDLPSPLAMAADLVFDFQLAVCEGVTNVIRHARPNNSCRVDLTVRGESITAVIVDFGPGFSLRPTPMPGPGSTGGRGIPLMQKLCDSVRYDRNTPNRLILTKSLAGSLQRV